MQGATTIYRI